MKVVPRGDVYDGLSLRTMNLWFGDRSFTNSHENNPFSVLFIVTQRFD
ncbi:MAG: hypothetical protein HWQ40_12060 [Nostoc sp. NMS9]|nr:hypothetical protein [Nostoc sp. NMS9]